MPSSFKENLDAVGDFIEKTGGTLTTCVSIVAIASTVVILSLNKIDLPAWAQTLLAAGGLGGIIYDPKKASVVQQQFQRPVENVAASSGSMSNISEMNVSADGYSLPPTEEYPTTGGFDSPDDEWLSPTEAAERYR